MARLCKKEVPDFVDRMEKLYPEAECALKFENPFQLLIAVVLSAQTTDKSVNTVTPRLFAEHPDAASIAAMPQEELEDILRRIGMYRTKAKNIRALCSILAEKHGGRVPENYDELVALPGVGRKTANVVLSVAFGQPRIAVDTHVFRLANRIGLAQEPDVLKTELALMKLLPEEYWIRLHHALIWHGRQVCTSRNPKCGVCGIADLCRKNGLK